MKFSEIDIPEYNQAVLKERESLIEKLKVEQFLEQLDSKPETVKKLKMPHRNDPCPCGSGKKYKKCCMEIDNKLIEQYDQRRKI